MDTWLPISLSLPSTTYQAAFKILLWRNKKILEKKHPQTNTWWWKWWQVSLEEVQLSTSSNHSRNCQLINQIHAEFLGSFVVPLEYEQTLEESLQVERQRLKRMKKLIGNWNSAGSRKNVSRARIIKSERWETWAFETMNCPNWSVL